MMKKYLTVEEYLADQPKDIRNVLDQLRNVIKEAAPEAEEVMSYGMPAFRQNGIIAYYAAFKNHFSFFPTSSGVAVFRDELSGFKCSKGTIQIPYSKELPVDLIKRIVKFRLEEISSKKKK